MPPKKTKNKQKKPLKASSSSSSSGGWLSKIPGLISDVAKIGAVVGPFMGLPMGAASGGGGGALGGIQSSRLITAPAQVGMTTRTPNWDFRKAPDVGYGPGIRISGRLILGEITLGTTYNGSTTPIRYIGLSASEGALSGGNIVTVGQPLSFVVLSPVSAFSGTATVGDPPTGTYGNSDNIIQHVATCFQRYKLVDATVVYEPSCGSADQHTIVISWIPDAGIVLNDAGEFNAEGKSGAFDAPALLDVNYAMSIPDSITTPSWAPATFVIPVDKAASREALYVNDIGQSSLGPIDTGDELSDSLQARQLFPGGFIFSGFGVDSTAQAASGGVLGSVFVDLTVDLYQMAMNAAPAMASGEYKTAAALSTTSCSSTVSRLGSSSLASHSPTNCPFIPVQRLTNPRPSLSTWFRRRYRRKVGTRKRVSLPPIDGDEKDGVMLGASSGSLSESIYVRKGLEMIPLKRSFAPPADEPTPSPGWFAGSQKSTK